MGEVTSVWVQIATAPGTYTGTDDHVYLGIYGTEGGREFALDVNQFDDWEPDSKVAYGFGPRGDAFSPGNYGPIREPTTAADQLDKISISQPDVTTAYLRKQGDRTPRGDDYWELSDCMVHLLSDERDPTRAFWLPGSVRLGNEYGHKVWLE
jgi:hypothetical protein